MIWGGSFGRQGPLNFIRSFVKNLLRFKPFETMQSMAEVHIPLALGAIAVFHSVPTGEIGGSLKLDACLLAKIFSGQVETWDHADIKA
jgi:ABC-type phosphate transport system substrate-binding protein